jgi:hypothetical protein
MNISCRPRFSTVLFGLSVVGILLVFTLSQFSFNAYKVRLIPGSLLERNLDRLPRKFGANMHKWFSKNFLRFQWEDIHCDQNKNETKNIIFNQWVTKLSKTLGVQDGQSLFDTNTGCLEWLKRFRSQFPNLDLAGFDDDYDAVDYAKRFFNDTTRKFVKRLLRARNNSFDYAINFAGLQTMRADKQCLEVKAILKTLKPGGILYIGHNLEQNCRSKICEQCLVDMEKIGFTILNKCFWPKMCLGREYDIYYVLERNFFASTEDFSDCRTGVFIRKKPGGKGNTDKTLPALKPSDIYYRC